MIDIDRTEPLTSKARLLALGQAVVEAETVDEAEWIEWKGTLDLRSKEGQFHVARAILGFANRMPDDAARWCGGYGYLLVGVQPGHVAGIDPVDGSDFAPGIDDYTGGGDGPRWDPLWLPVGDLMVLAVVADPPRWGDRIWRLRKTHGTKGGAADGTVFVRRGSRTAPATADQHHRLEIRATTRPADDVTIEITTVGEPLSWFDPAAIQVALGVLADQLMADEWAASDEVRNPPSSGPVAPAISGDVQRTIMEQVEGTIAAFGQRIAADAMERRSWAQYERELAAYREQILSSLVEEFLRAFHEAGHGQLQLVVTNPTGRHLDDVEITFSLPASVRVFEEPPDAAPRPDPPPRWGSDLGLLPRSALGRFDAASLMQFSHDSVLPAVGADVVYVDDDGNVVVTLQQLRQHASVRLDPIWLELHAEDPIEVTWIARIRNPEALLEGTLRLAVAHRGTDVAAPPPRTDTDRR